MTRWGEVSYRVKRAVAFHERFTIAQLTDSTGLTYEQVEQVVHRLVNHGDVRRLLPEELTEAEQEVEKRAGRPCARYTLTEDPIRRAEFLADLEAMTAAARLELAPTRRPDTPYYAAALRAIEAMEAGEEEVQLARLGEVEEFLTYGREYEALVAEGLEMVRAYYDLALARLKSLRKEFPAAQRLLEQAESTLTQAGLQEEVQRVTEWRLAVQVGQGLAEVAKVLHRESDALPILERLRESLRRASRNPLCRPLYQAVELMIEVMASSSQVRTTVHRIFITVRADAWAKEQQEAMLAGLERTATRSSPEFSPAHHSFGHSNVREGFGPTCDWDIPFFEASTSRGWLYSHFSHTDD
jgi:hypothetical protein